MQWLCEPLPLTEGLKDLMSDFKLAPFSHKSIKQFRINFSYIKITIIILKTPYINLKYK